MKHTKKIIAIFLAVIMSLALASCDDSTDNETITMDTIKIAIIFSGDPTVEDAAGYDLCQYDAIKEAFSTLNYSENDKLVIEKNVEADSASIAKAVNDCVGKGCDLVISTNPDYFEFLNEQAKKYTAAYFAQFTDRTSKDINKNSNVVTYSLNLYQSEYLCGIAAGLNCKDEIIYEKAKDTSINESVMDINAFALGVSSVNQKAKITLTKELTRTTDVVVAHNSEFANDKYYNANVITGMNTGASALLTGTVINFGVYYSQIIQGLVNGASNDEEIIPPAKNESFLTLDNYVGDFKNGVLGVYPADTDATGLAVNEITQVEKLFSSGKWDVFTGKHITFNNKGVIEYGKTETTTISEYAANIVEG